MGKMYTIQPNESINDHVKESMSIINHIVELSIGCMRDLANPHEGTFVDMTYNKFMRSLEHIRESIQMLDELCDELEDNNDEIRHEYEEKVIQFFNRFMNSDLADEYKERSNQLEKEFSRLKAQYGELQKELKDTALNRDANLKLYTAERERSNQLEEQLTAIKGERDLAKKLARRLLDEKNAIKTDLMRAELECKNLRVVLDKKYAEIEELTKENFALEKRIPDYFKAPNNPVNFCGNCRHYAQMGKDDGDFEGICTQHYIKRVDPDDASCSHFKSTYDTRVVIGKPEFPCCDHCNHDDCDDCTLCPF